jgi:hypothetical protein
MNAAPLALYARQSGTATFDLFLVNVGAKDLARVEHRQSSLSTTGETSLDGQRLA